MRGEASATVRCEPGTFVLPRCAPARGGPIAAQNQTSLRIRKESENTAASSIFENVLAGTCHSTQFRLDVSSCMQVRGWCARGAWAARLALESGERLVTHATSYKPCIVSLLVCLSARNVSQCVPLASFQWHFPTELLICFLWLHRTGRWLRTRRGRRLPSKEASSRLYCSGSEFVWQPGAQTAGYSSPLVVVAFLEI